MLPYVVMRCHNDMPLMEKTVMALKRQTVSHRLIVFDQGSTDGSLEFAKRRAEAVYHAPPDLYPPGRLWNSAMRATEGEFVVFLEADCTPSDDKWLENLLRAFEHNRGAAAVFSRQTPRDDCPALIAKDMKEAYGEDERRAGSWRNSFSITACAIRRAVWCEIPFDETLPYGEDLDWTWKARAMGAGIRYAPQSQVYHSHNYTWRQYFNRSRAEGRSESHIFDWARWQASILRHTVLPYVRQVLSDWAYCARRLSLKGIVASPIMRLIQMHAYRVGVRQGLRKSACEKAEEVHDGKVCPARVEGA